MKIFGGENMKRIKNMLLGIGIMVGSTAFYSAYDSDLIAVVIAFVGRWITAAGYLQKGRKAVHRCILPNIWRRADKEAKI